ncbi:hypothetical protein AAG906_022232 [Vitis piasezkii]
MDTRGGGSKVQGKAAHKDLELDQLDVKTTFLHGELDELIYMQPLKGFGILGMEIERDRSKRVLRLSQKSYISKVLSKFEMNNVKTVSTPLGQHFRLSITQAPKTHEEKRFMERIPYASMVGSVMYTMVCSRPNLAYAKANLQSVVAFSTNEAEYMAMTKAVKETIWLKGIIEELAMYRCGVVVYYDNQSAIQLSKNQFFHERSKHIDVRLHFVRDIIAIGEIGVGKIPTKDNPSDMLTKSLNMTKFKHCLNLSTWEIAKDFPLGKVLRLEGSSDTCQLNRLSRWSFVEFANYQVTKLLTKLN